MLLGRTWPYDIPFSDDNQAKLLPEGFFSSKHLRVYSYYLRGVLLNVVEIRVVFHKINRK